MSKLTLIGEFWSGLASALDVFTGSSSLITYIYLFAFFSYMHKVTFARLL